MSNEFLFTNQHQIDRNRRSGIKGHKPLVIWMTGLSGSGKSTIANMLESRLVEEYSAHTYLLDGDNIRQGLNAGLGFSIKDRSENIRRAGEVAKLMYDAGLIVITAFISPLRSDRDMVRNIFPLDGFWEIFISCPLEICQGRDPKGLYQKAIKGEIPEFTGISSPYEDPISPEITIDSANINIKNSVDVIIRHMVNKKIIAENH